MEVVIMRVLVTWGSKLGGTEEIARTVGEELAAFGLDVIAQPASHVPDTRGYDAAIIGGAVYANRWHRDTYRFVTRNIAGLRRIPVWLFSSGPLDESADQSSIPPPRQVSALMERIGARGYATFGGRLAADAKGFPAAALARSHSGDWRNPTRIRAWAAQLAHDLPEAGPGAPSDPPARSVWRLLAHGAAGWALCAALMAVLLQATSLDIAIAIHAVAAPLIFAAIAVNYFRAHGAREPLPTALTFTGIVVLLDVGVVALLVLQSFAMFASVAGTWLPFGLIFLATWATGVVISMLPAGKPRLAAGGTAAVSGRPN
jgi:menaquinone-dependent protoporphyrinogen oxidase